MEKRESVMNLQIKFISYGCRSTDSTPHNSFYLPRASPLLATNFCNLLPEGFSEDPEIGSAHKPGRLEALGKESPPGQQPCIKSSWMWTPQRLHLSGRTAPNGVFGDTSLSFSPEFKLYHRQVPPPHLTRKPSRTAFSVGSLSHSPMLLFSFLFRSVYLSSKLFLFRFLS